MELDVRRGDPLTEPADVVVLLVASGVPLPDQVARLIVPEDVPDTANAVALAYGRDGVAARRLLLVGLGGEVAAETVRQAVGVGVRRARELGAVVAVVGVIGPTPLPAREFGESVALGAHLGAYRYLRHRTTTTDAERHEVERVTLLLDAPDVADADHDEVAVGVADGTAMARGVITARDLVNLPPESKTPPLLADLAVDALGSLAGVTIEVYDEHRLDAEGFGGILAVGRASAAPPRLIVAEYGEHLTDVPTVCLVGKGLTFDSGGLNVKNAEGMLTMKNDMGGAAAVFGAIQVVATLGLPVHVIGLVPSAENMIAGNAYRPGDIVTSKSGTTIEIINTDAEGRVILCDALHEARRFRPDVIVNLATLTGAVVMALGPYASGLFTNDDDLASRLAEAGDTTADRVWRFPMDGEYADLSKSEIADLKNHPGKFAGSIGAAVFLSAFVGDVPFAHLDIAGTAWIDAPKRPYHWPGGTGAGVLVVTEYLRRLVDA